MLPSEVKPTAEVKPLEQLDWEEIKHAVDTKLRAAYPGGSFFPPRTMIEICYRVVAAKLEELKAKETNNG